MIEVELPDGRVVEVDTNDPNEAARAAHAFQTKSARAPQSAPRQSRNEQSAPRQSRNEQSAPRQSRNDPLSVTNDFLARANNMLMFGGEPLYKGGLAGLGAMFKGEDPRAAFSQARQAASADQARIKRERPWLSVPAETLGGAIPLVLSGGGTAPTQISGQVSRSARPMLDIAKTGAGYGATFGGLDAASREGVDATPEIYQGMAAGGLTGAVAAPLLTKGVESSATFAGNIGKSALRLMKSALGDDFAKASSSQVGMGLGGLAKGKTPPPARPRITGEQKAAGRQVARGWINDEVTPEQVLQRQQSRAERGGGALDTNAEAAGPNSIETLRAFASVPGPAKARTEAFMEARAEGAPMRIRDAANAQLNPEGRNLYDELSRLTATQKEKAAPFFAQADKTPILTEDIGKIQSFLNRPSGKEALAAARRLAAERGETLPKEGYDFKTLRYVREALDDAVESAAKVHPVTGKKEWDSQGQAIIETRAGFDKLLKSLSDERTGGALRKGDMIFRGAARQKSALEAGRKIFTTDAELSAAKLARMSEDEVKAYQIGVARAIVDKAAGVTDSAAANYGGKIAGKQILRERLRPAFKDEKSYEEFMQPIRDEVRRSATARNVLPNVNSKTTPSAIALADVFADMAAGDPTAGSKALAATIAKIRKNSPANEKVNRAVAEMMLGTADDAERALQPAIREYRKMLNRQQVRQGARYAAGRAAGAQAVQERE